MQPGLETKLELKYCEGCGALGIRPAGAIYCLSCYRMLQQQARPAGSRRPPVAGNGKGGAQ